MRLRLRLVCLFALGTVIASPASAQTSGRYRQRTSRARTQSRAEQPAAQAKDQQVANADQAREQSPEEATLVNPQAIGKTSATNQNVAANQRKNIDSEGFGAALSGVTDGQAEQFQEGRDTFRKVESLEEGLGPVFNDVSCEACHSVPVVGGGSERLETRFGTTKNGLFDPLEQLGGSLLQDHGIGLVNSCNPAVTFQAEVVPREATIIAQRRTTPLFGLGLVDAVPDATFRSLRDQEARTSPTTAGTLNEVVEIVSGNKVVGKFGWKGQNPTLFQFAADAYFNEVGATSAQFPAENCPQGNCALIAQCNPAETNPNDDGDDVVAFTNFMTLLAPPPRGPITAGVQAGEQEFQTLGCADCHTPTLKTGISSVKALDQVTFHPFSDFLLHDMGPLGDGIEQNDANGRLMRTAPLWGLRKITRLLHDGRATSVEAAITAHDGQGVAARERFLALPADRRGNLLAFLGSL